MRKAMQKALCHLSWGLRCWLKVLRLAFRLYIRGYIEDYIRGLYGENGKENGNYNLGFGGLGI